MTSIDFQRRIVAKLCAEAVSGSFSGEVAASTNDYTSDRRMFLGFVALPGRAHANLFIAHQKELSPYITNGFAIPRNALHFTIKNIRTIAYPPNFAEEQVSELQRELVQLNIPSFRFTFEDYLITPTSIGIAAYASPGFHQCERLLDSAATKAGLPDNKKYNGGRPLFSNITLVRFCEKLTLDQFRAISQIPIKIPPIQINSVHLIRSNLAFTPSIAKTYAEIPLMSTVAEPSDAPKSPVDRDFES